MSAERERLTFLARLRLLTSSSLRNERREELVLDALRQGQELSSYELRQASVVNPGTFYPVVRRLEARGRILSRWDDGRGKADEPRPRLYRIAP